MIAALVVGAAVLGQPVDSAGGRPAPQQQAPQERSPQERGTSAPQPEVELRGRGAAPAGAVAAVSAAGVTVGDVVIGWDRVRAVRGAMGPRAAPFLRDAEELWRARTRLERGDPIAAEPLFERQFERTRGQTGPTASVVAEGLLRCRVRRAAHVAAIDPWLALLQARSEGTVLHPEWALEAGLAPVVDAETGLVASVPPMWVAWPSVEAFARSKPWAGGSEGAHAERVAALAAMYHAAAQFEAGMPVKLPAISGPMAADAGVRLVREIVEARVGDEGQRGAARAVLEEWLRVRPSANGDRAAPAPWIVAWVHAAIGRSLIREDSPEQKRLGVIALLRLPAEHADVHPYLTGLALAEAAAALRATGDPAGADVLARELIEHYPTHPVNDWEPLRAWRPKTGMGTTSPARPEAAPPKVQ